MKEKVFWKEFFSGDNSKVNTMAVVAIVLAAPIVAISMVALAYHIFVMEKGLDSPSVQLLIALVGAATGGLGVSMFSRSLWGAGSGARDALDSRLPGGPRPKVPPAPRKN